MWNEWEVKYESNAKNKIFCYKKNDSFFSITFVEKMYHVIVHRFPLEGFQKE